MPAAGGGRERPIFYHYRASQGFKEDRLARYTRPAPMSVEKARDDWRRKGLMTRTLLLVEGYPGSLGGGEGRRWLIFFEVIGLS